MTAPIKENAVNALNRLNPITDIHARRFDGITRPYTQAQVEKLRGTVHVEYSSPASARCASGSCSTPAPT